MSGSGKPFKATSAVPSVITNSTASPFRLILKLTVSLNSIGPALPFIKAAIADCSPFTDDRLIGFRRLIETVRQTILRVVAYLSDKSRLGTTIPNPNFERGA
jgi:hypothetical protein